MTAIDLVISRLDREEGERALPYDDATGKSVRAPVGNLSWGYGFNLMQIGSTELFEVIERHLVGKIEEQLMPHTFYSTLDPVRQSVLLDIAYNDGVNGLLDYHRMLSAIETKDWTTAAKECTTSNPRLASRYETLSRILVTGDP